MPKTANKEKHTDIVWSRVDAVVNLILENDRYLQSKRNSELMSLVAAKFEVSPRTAFRYIAEAKKEIRKISNSDKKAAFVKAMRDREFLYKKAISPSFIFSKDLKDKEGNLVLVADLKLALEVARDRDKLQGLYVEELKVSGEINHKPDLSGLTIEDLKELAALKRK